MAKHLLNSGSQIGYNIILSGGVTVAKDAGLGGRDCLEFDGTGYFSLGASPPNIDFDYDEPFSCGCLVKSIDSANAQGLFSKNVDNVGFRIWYEDGERFRFDIVKAWSTELLSIKTATGTLPIHKWNNCIATYDGSNSTDGMNLYINGVKQAIAVTTNNAIAGSISNAGKFCIGASNDGNLYLLNGFMSNPTIWNKALSQSQAKEWTRQIRGMV